MGDTAFVNTDGELMLVPYMGRLLLQTEMGHLEISPGHIAVIPRGIKFSVDLLDEMARGYVCENYGAAFSLPEHGLVGVDANALPRDFEYPVARYDDDDQPTKLVAKISGALFANDLQHSPFDVVAWHGNLAPYRYELRRFCALGPVIFDHPTHLFGPFYPHLRTLPELQTLTSFSFENTGE